MDEEAIRPGRVLVEKEKDLDELFAERRARAHKLRELSSEISKIGGKLRFVHLHAHLKMSEVLSAATNSQVWRVERVQ